MLIRVTCIGRVWLRLRFDKICNIFCEARLSYCNGASTSQPCTFSFPREQNNFSYLENSESGREGGRMEEAKVDMKEARKGGRKGGWKEGRWEREREREIFPTAKV